MEEGEKKMEWKDERRRKERKKKGKRRRNGKLTKQIVKIKVTDI